MQVDASGNALVTGMLEEDRDMEDVFVMKFNSMGALLGIVQRKLDGPDSSWRQIQSAATAYQAAESWCHKGRCPYELSSC